MKELMLKHEDTFTPGGLLSGDAVVLNSLLVHFGEVEIIVPEYSVLECHRHGIIDTLNPTQDDRFSLKITVDREYWSSNKDKHIEPLIYMTENRVPLAKLEFPNWELAHEEYTVIQPRTTGFWPSYRFVNDPSVMEPYTIGKVYDISEPTEPWESTISKLAHANVYCGINSGPAWIAAAAGVPTKLWLRDYKEHPTDTGLRFVKLLVQQSNVEVIEWIDRR